MQLNKNKLNGSFLWIGCNKPIAAQPPKRDGLLLTNKPLGVPRTYLVDLEQMKGRFQLGAI